MSTAAARLLSAFPYLATTNLEEAREGVGRQFVQHRLDLQRGAGQVNAVQNSVILRAASLHFLDYGADVHVSTSERRDFHLVVLPLSGLIQVSAGDASAAADPRTACILPSDRGFRLRWSSDCSAVIVRVDDELVQRCLAVGSGLRTRRPIGFALTCDTASGTGAFFREFAFTSAMQFDRDPALTSHAILRGEIPEMLARCMIGAIPHAYTEILNTPSGRAPPRCVRHVMSYIHEHAGDPLPLELLIEVGGVSGRSLQAAFLRQVGMSPTEYVRKVRLDRVRADLLAASRGDLEATVTDVALKWGFGHFGRFSAYYRRAFGELPRETLRR